MIVCSCAASLLVPDVHSDVSAAGSHPSAAEQVAGALNAVPRSLMYLLPLSLVIAVYLTFVIYLIMGPSR